VIVETVGVGVAGRFPRRGRLCVVRRGELDPGQLAVPGQVHRERLPAPLEGHRDLHGDHGAIGLIAGRGADRGQLAAFRQLGLPGGPQPVGGDHRAQPRGEQLANLVELPGPGELDHGQCARLWRYRERFRFGGGHGVSLAEPDSSGAGSMTV
jgi:hypothetical protein